MTRAKQANESSETDPKKSKHGEDLYQNADEGDCSYAIDFKGEQNFGERQPIFAHSDHKYGIGLRPGMPHILQRSVGNALALQISLSLDDSESGVVFGIVLVICSVVSDATNYFFRAVAASERRFP